MTNPTKTNEKSGEIQPSKLSFKHMIKYLILTLFRWRNISLVKCFPRPFDKFLKVRYGNKSIIGAEIGVLAGEHASFMNKYLNIKKFYLVDSYIESDDFSQDFLNKAKIKAKNKLPGGNIIWIEKKSTQAVLEIKDKLDFIYIDSDHTYQYVKQEIEKYYPLVNKGGILGGHDFFSFEAGNYIVPENYGVVEAVLEFITNNKLKLWIGKYGEWWIIK